MQIFVKTLTGKTITLDVQCFRTSMLALVSAMLISRFHCLMLPILIVAILLKAIEVAQNKLQCLPFATAEAAKKCGPKMDLRLKG